MCVDGREESNDFFFGGDFIIVVNGVTGTELVPSYS